MPELSNPSSSCTPSRRAFHGARVAFWLAILLIAQSRAQNLPGGGQPHSSAQPLTSQLGLGSLDDPMDPGDSVVEERRLRQLNIERQKSMISDTNRLLKLATELQAEIGRANPSAFTAAQVHKLGEIEKLAHGVKDKMGSAGNGPPAFRSVPLRPYR
jgi:hypothetical protein